MADWLTHLALQGIGAPVFYPLGISPLKPAFFIASFTYLPIVSVHCQSSRSEKSLSRTMII